jgi:hypothetical protein
MVGVGFFLFPLCSIKISMCSEHIPQILSVFLNMFPIATHNVTHISPINIVLHPSIGLVGIVVRSVVVPCKHSMLIAARNEKFKADF